MNFGIYLSCISLYNCRVTRTIGRMLRLFRDVINFFAKSEKHLTNILLLVSSNIFVASLVNLHSKEPTYFAKKEVLAR